MASTNVSLQALEEKLIYPETDLRHLSAEQQFARIMAKVADLPEPVITPSDLLERLKISKQTGIPLKVKFGIDPTGPDIHIGHAVSLINLRLFQRMGHKVVLVIGDFTGMIGDPSGRVDARPALSEEQIHQNMATYEEQASRVIDLRDPTIERHYNSKWMSQLNMRQWVEIVKNISASALLQREDFRTRLSSGQSLSIAELEYAIFMGYDSVVLNPDIEMGGIDQYLNMHMCRQMMTNAGQKSEIIIAYNLLAGTTGERDIQGRLIKMSKSRENYIPVTGEPSDIYGKVMAIPDDIMWIWYRELTEISPSDLETLRISVNDGSIHPKEAKHLLARVIVGTFNHYDSKIIRAAEDDFNSKFGQNVALIPESTETILIMQDETLIDTLARVTTNSKGHIRRLAQQQGIRMLCDQEYIPISIDDLYISSSQLKGNIMKIGRRYYYKLEV